MADGRLAHELVQNVAGSILYEYGTPEQRELARAIKRARQDRLKAQVEQELRISEIERMVGEEL